jgi:uncharacterized membrane protein YdjX (TVP38/TMEM64 family)
MMDDAPPPSDPAPPARRGAAAVRLAGIAFVLLVLASVAAGFAFEWSRGFSSQEIEQTIRGWGAWGVAASLGLMVVHSVVPFPAEFVAIANGMVYGPFWGVVITWSGAMLGAFLAFGLARRFGRPFVAAMVTERQWRHVDDWAAVEGGRLILVSRFFPVIAFNLINYAAGLTRVSWWTFTWATGLGILPLTVLMVVMGDRIRTLPWHAWAATLAAFLVLWVVFHRRLLRRATRDRGNDGQ